MRNAPALLLISAVSGTLCAPSARFLIQNRHAGATISTPFGD